MKPLRLALALVVVVAISACVPTHAGVSFSTWTTVAPPAPLVEVAPTMVHEGYVWVNGYWWWNGQQYVWIRGHWAPRPVDGYVWAPSGWVFLDGHYRFIAGRWTRPGTRSHVRYVHPVPRVRVQHGARYHTRGHTIGGALRRHRR